MVRPARLACAAAWDGRRRPCFRCPAPPARSPRLVARELRSERRAPSKAESASQRREKLRPPAVPRTPSRGANAIVRGGVDRPDQKPRTRRSGPCTAAVRSASPSRITKIGWRPGRSSSPSPNWPRDGADPSAATAQRAGAATPIGCPLGFLGTSADYPRGSPCIGSKPSRSLGRLSASFRWGW